MHQKINLRFGIIVFFIIIAAISRILPHPPNFTPIGGMALFGAAYFTRKYWVFIIPFLALWFSDLIINNVVYPIQYPEYYNGFLLFTEGWYVMYGAFALIALMGMGLLKKITIPNLIGVSVLASVSFFLITNFGAWAVSPAYPKTVGGLMACYAAGIPFFWNTLAGDLFYVTVLFGAYEFLKQRYPQLAVG